MKNVHHYQKYQKYKQRYNYMTGGDSNRQTFSKPGDHQVEVSGCKKTMFFFDNDANNFRDRTRCMCVLPVEIEESRSIGSVSGLPIFVDQSTFNKYVDRLPTGARSYGKSIIRNKGIDSYDPRSGLRTADIKYYCQQLKKPSFRSRVGAFIFDWDRTLTVFEGVPAGYGSLSNLLSQKDGISSDIKGSDVATYYLGGKERVDALQCLFKDIHQTKIPIYILSANRGVEKYKLFFWELLKSVDIHVDPANMIYRGHLSKYQYIEDMLPNLCSGN